MRPRRRRRAEKASNGLTLFFATDIHGSEICFRKFVNAARFYGANVLVLGGDVTGKLVVPLVPQPDGGYLARLGGQTGIVTEDERAAFDRKLADQGCYVFETEDSNVLTAGLSADEVEEAFRRAMADGFARWLELAEERLAGSGVRCFISPGNDDPWELDAVLASSDYVENPDGKVVALADGVEMLSYGTTNPTPWNSPRELEEEELWGRLDALAQELTEPAQSVFNLHCPPVDTDLDKAPELDEDLRVRTVVGNPVMSSVGSSAVRRLIETYEPQLGLHGHVHESRGATKLGRTLCINPGSDYGDSVLRGALVTFSVSGVDSYQLVSG
jgi:Icc-related predicted phosphoesterase